MNVPPDRSYTKDHEWVQRGPDGVTVGITDYAQAELTDIVFVDLPEIGRHVNPGDELCALESVKAVAYIYSPVAGAVSAVNDKLSAQPELINQDPYGEAWVLRLAPDEPEQTVPLLDADAYRAHLQALAERADG